MPPSLVLLDGAGENLAWELRANRGALVGVGFGVGFGRLVASAHAPEGEALFSGGENDRVGVHVCFSLLSCVRRTVYIIPSFATNGNPPISANFAATSAGC